MANHALRDYGMSLKGPTTNPRAALTQTSTLLPKGSTGSMQRRAHGRNDEVARKYEAQRVDDAISRMEASVDKVSQQLRSTATEISEA